MRILFLGENWYGSCARACCYALRRLGCDVIDIDCQTIFPQLRRPIFKLALRLIKGGLIKEYNDLVLKAAADFKPDFLLAFKGPFIEAKTLQTLRNQGISSYNYYPDKMIFARNTLIEEAIKEYDCIFDTKRFWDGNIKEQIKVRDLQFLPHGYDPEIHRPLPLETKDKEQYQADVGFIGTWSPRKENILKELISLKPNIDLKIWGNQWYSHCRTPELLRFVKGEALNGDRYAKANRAIKINLAIMGITTDVVDETTTRTYEIPACGGFMLHERSAELEGLYEEGKEVACFDKPNELVEKIDYYLIHSDERKGIAEAGHRRCVPAYSYDKRMNELIQWHESRQRQK